MMERGEHTVSGYWDGTKTHRHGNKTRTVRPFTRRISHKGKETGLCIGRVLVYVASKRTGNQLKGAKVKELLLLYQYSVGFVF